MATDMRDDLAAVVTPIRILLVEDSPGDIALTREALDEARLINDLDVATDGLEAIEYLRSDARPRPDIVILDLNLPRMDGREVLYEIKRDPDLHTIPVVVLTTSDADEDVAHAYDHYVNAYIQKPIDFNEFTQVVRTLGEFWLSIVRLPTNR